MTDEEKNEIINAIKAESVDVNDLEKVEALDDAISLPAVQNGNVVTVPISLLASPAIEAAQNANSAAENANAAAEHAEEEANKAAEATVLANKAAEEAQSASSELESKLETEISNRQIADTENKNLIEGDPETVKNNIRNPFTYLGNFDTWTEIQAELDKLHSQGEDNTKVGEFRMQLNNRNLIVRNFVQNWATGVFTQTVQGSVRWNAETQTMDQSLNINTYERRYNEGTGWTTWEEGTAKIELAQELSTESGSENKAISQKAVSTSIYDLQNNKLNVDDIEQTVTEISSDILSKNKTSFLSTEGKLIAGIDIRQIVSDFIEITGIIKEVYAVFTGSNAGFAFYSEANEESFISASNENTSSSGYWKIYKGKPVVPEGAKYIRIAGNKAVAGAADTPQMSFVNYGINYDELNNRYATKKEFNELYDSIDDIPVPVDNEKLTLNTNCILAVTGELVTSDNNKKYVSDFIEITGIIKEVYAVFTGSNAGFAFYSEANEESFISASNESNTSVISWKAYKGKPVVPEGAKYIRIAGNKHFGDSGYAYINMVKKGASVNNRFEDAPLSGEEFFEYDVDVTVEDFNDENKSLDVSDATVTSKDNGYILLSKNYTKDGKPSRLVIFNHGAGQSVTSTSASLGGIGTLLSKKGYSVLCINGLPQSMRNEKYLNLAQHMGSWIYVRCLLAAYNYVTNKYNIDRGGVFIAGQSMGGLAALNPAITNIIPVIAIALDAPVISAYRDAYFGGGWSTGTLNASTPGIFAWVYQFDFCDFENDTYTLPIGSYSIFGKTYKVESEVAKPISDLKSSATDMIILWYLNRAKLSGYDPYKTGDFLFIVKKKWFANYTNEI